MEPLKEGEIICPECKGKGEFPVLTRKRIIRWYDACEKCLGHGKLDWIEMIVGKSSWRIRPGVFTREVDLSSLVPSFEQSIKEMRESIIKSCGIPKAYLGIKE
jgi:hypothetical protein